MRWLILLLLPITCLAKDDKIIDSITWAAQVAEVPKDVLLAICKQESGPKLDGKTHMDGDSLSHGICQVKLETAQHMDEVFNHKMIATGRKLEDPKFNALYAAKYLKWNLNRYKGNVKQAIDAYNKGHFVSENSEYVRSVFKNISGAK